MRSWDPGQDVGYYFLGGLLPPFFTVLAAALVAWFAGGLVPAGFYAWVGRTPFWLRVVAMVVLGAPGVLLGASLGARNRLALAVAFDPYASLFPWLDRLFGTYHLPADSLPSSYGANRKLPPGLTAQLLSPFIQPGAADGSPVAALTTEQPTQR